MQKKWKVLLVAAVAVLTLAVGSGIALAQRPSAPAAQTAQTDADDNAAWCGGSGAYGFDNVTLGRIATLLGTTVDQLRTQLSSGQSLAEIASAAGVSNDALIDAILAPQQEQLALRVKYGYLTQEQADQALTNARTRLNTVITQKATAGATGTGTRGYGGMMGGSGGMMGGAGGMMGGAGGMMGGGAGGMMGGSTIGSGFGGMMGGSRGGMMGY